MNFQSLKCFTRINSNRDNGDKIILPVSILDTLITMEVQYPLTFELITNQTKTHCGVLEFTAEEGICFIPLWIMKNLYINDGDSIYIRNVALQKASFIKFKPDMKFLDLSDPRAVLEYTLRTFSCVTIGDKLTFEYNNKEYILEVTDVKPKKACCIIEADIEVEFDELEKQVKEIKEKEPKEKEILKNNTQIKEITGTATKWGKTSKIAHFQGKGNKLN